ncbi:MAG: hypothetical protein ABIH34_03830 [Nanoarchaeota archaeon]
MVPPFFGRRQTPWQIIIMLLLVFYGFFFSINDRWPRLFTNDLSSQEWITLGVVTCVFLVGMAARTISPKPKPRDITTTIKSSEGTEKKAVLHHDPSKPLFSLKGFFKVIFSKSQYRSQKDLLNTLKVNAELPDGFMETPRARKKARIYHLGQKQKKP